MSQWQNRMLRDDRSAKPNLFCQKREATMRALLRLPLLLSVLTLFPGAGLAGSGVRQIEVSNSEKIASPEPAYQTYRGYVYDLSENAGRRDSVAMADELRQQLDVVESVGLSPLVLNFFHKIPIVADEMACLQKVAAVACYGSSAPSRSHDASRELTIWDGQKHKWTNSDVFALAEDTAGGIVMIRPSMMRNAQDPVMLHEFLHAYHAQLLPNGYRNEGLLVHYNLAKTKQFYPAESDVLKNEREFFAITASIFLSGKDSVHEPFTREALKEKQPEYFRYLVALFGLDPDHANTTPVASAN
jgi:hypothetical protein